MATWTKSLWTQATKANPAHVSVYEVLEFAKKGGNLQTLEDPLKVHHIVCRAEGKLNKLKKNTNLEDYHRSWLIDREVRGPQKDGEEENDEEVPQSPPLRGVSVVPEPSEDPGPSVRVPSVSPSVEPSVREPSVRSTPKRKVSATFWEVEGCVEDVERLITEVKKPKK
jgi:hypothetical protein